MSRNLYKLTKSFDDVVVISILLSHHHFDVSRLLKKPKVFKGVLLNISKTVQLIFIKLLSFFGQLSKVSFEIK